jgi:hypothetical protein
MNGHDKTIHEKSWDSDVWVSLDCKAQEIEVLKIIEEMEFTAGWSSEERKC